MIKFEYSGSFKNLDSFLERASKFDIHTILNRYGEEGVRALQAATPLDSGKTAASWGYTIKQSRRNEYSISWTNSNVESGVNIAVILQYGHGTNRGGYVQGIDYINPAMKPIFEKLAENAWREVTR